MIIRSTEIQNANWEIKEFHQRTTKYAIVIPVLNEGQTLVSQLQRMQNANCPGDILLVDGGSRDGSTCHQTLTELGVRCLLTTNEQGLGAALRIGIGYAVASGYEGVITIDGNGKDGVDAIPRFVDRLNDGYDLVQGSRFMTGGKCENTPIDRYLGIRFFIAPLLSIASRFPYSDPTNGLKAMSRSLMTDARMGLLRPELNSFDFQFYLNYRAPLLGFKVIEIPVSRVYPKSGPTPTKIVGVRRKLRLVTEFLWTIFGLYNPDRRHDR